MAITQWNGFTIPERWLDNLKRDYTRPWIESQVTGGTQPTEAQIVAKMNEVPDDVQEDWRAKVYSAIVSKEAQQSGPEMVDLGLQSGILWAKCNIGAASETAAGKYFAWGCIEGFEASELSSEIFSENWYSNQPGRSLIDDIYDLDEEHNAAYAAYGEGYTMPKQSDFQELIDSTNYSWAQVGGVNGWKFSNKNDDSKYIFIPASGFGVNGHISGNGEHGDVWSSSFKDESNAYYLYFNSGNINISNLSRCHGMTIRPIKKQA